MEVHHGKVEKKNFREYLLEGLMIFIAVTLGFIAENIREYHTEKINARQFLRAYRDELIQQQGLFEKYKKIYQMKGIASDSIKHVFFNRDENKNISVFQRLAVRALQNIELPLNTSSYDQMVSSGALRFIENIALRDSMSAYKGQIEILKNYNTRIFQIIDNNAFEVSRFIDLHDIMPLDTSGSVNFVQQLPNLLPFEKLSEDQRRSLVWFFESNIILVQFNLRNMRTLNESNKSIIGLVNEELAK
jgi:hypothetical protein